MADSVLAPVRDIFRAIATTVVPEAAALDAGAWTEAERLIENALAIRPAGVRVQIRVFIRLIEWLSIVRFGRRFTALEAGRRARVLLALQSSPVLLLRRGFWGLRTLAFLAYYARPEARAAIGYRADARGWEIRR